MPNRGKALWQMPGAVRGQLAPRRHTALLVAIVAAFAVRPLVGDTGVAPLVFSMAMLVLVFIALYNIQIDEMVGEREKLVHQRRRWLAVGWALGLLAIGERVVVFIEPTESIMIGGSICWLLLLSFITWQELRAVLRQKQVTGQTISMAISAYLLLGITWGLLYILLYQLQPGAFSFGGSTTLPAAAATSDQAVLPVLTYFSLITLATVGYGDIAPLSLQARYLSVAEGITGQFYLAILVARLVAMQMSRSEQREPPAKPERPEAERSSTAQR
jgi:Ion channel